jgi:GTPase SAR1 family protein
VLLVFDLSASSTLNAMRKYSDELILAMKAQSYSASVCVAVIGNKADDSTRTVSKEASGEFVLRLQKELEACTTRSSVKYFETSAADGDNVNNVRARFVEKS